MKFWLKAFVVVACSLPLAVIVSRENTANFENQDIGRIVSILLVVCIGFISGRILGWWTESDG